ncbi:MAG: tetratricopeptide repeat protein [Woeseiaceae bacterium]|nr:tetratricopeptide repeat protein [Woeseiaceae bacterium]
MVFVSELKRRNVFRMALLYAVAAWLILQVAEVMVELGNLPDGVGPWILGILAVGFPIALLLSWFYELTPEGIKLERQVERSASIRHLSGRRMDFIVIAMLSAAVLVFSWDKWATPPPSEQSIAVLPFAVVGADQETIDVLAAGIQEGLLTHLSKIHSFKTISRTSTIRYRGTTNNIKRIGAELGVRKIVEGSVQQSGDQIRVNVQLIDTQTDQHLWAETYDRTITASNVFALQSEIVQTIARKLDATLTQREVQQLASVPTQNFEAYTEYLRGKQCARAESVEALHVAIEHFVAATEMDPEFALAYVGLADAYLTLSANFQGGLTAEEATALAEPPLTRALALDPGLGEAHASLGFLRQEQGNLEAAEGYYLQAISLRPSYSRAFRLYGRLRLRQGKLDDAMAFAEQALQLDPYSAAASYDLARLHDDTGDFDKAMLGYLRVIDIEPNHAFAHVYIAAIHYLVHGRIDESIIWYNKAAATDAMSPSLQASQALAYLELDDPDAARIWVERGLELGPDTFWVRWASTMLNLYVGDEEAAQQDARALLEIQPGNWGALRVLRDADLSAGRYETARSRYARAYRELVEPEVPDVNESNYSIAVDLALVLQRLGETDRADDLLETSLKAMAPLQRGGVSGFWLNDVRAYALQDRPERALEAFREAIEDGWRFQAWYYLDIDPNLDSIRGTDEFERLRAVLQADLAAQAQRVRDMMESGELAQANDNSRGVWLPVSGAL